MRAVFSAMRRLLIRQASVLASAGRGARRTSRCVARTAGPAWRGNSLSANSSDVITRGSRLAIARAAQKRKGEPVSGLPLHGTLVGPPVRLDTGRPRYG